MGHDIAIHKNIFRQPVTEMDILSISQILERAQEIMAGFYTMIIYYCIEKT